jgi:hypothetical protein
MGPYSNTLVGIMASCDKFEVEWEDPVRVKNLASPMQVEMEDCDFDEKEVNRERRAVSVEEQLGKMEPNTARLLLQEHLLGLEHRLMEHTGQARHRQVHRRQVPVQAHRPQVLVVGYYCYCDLNSRFLATDGSVVGRVEPNRARLLLQGH